MCQSVCPGLCYPVSVSVTPSPCVSLASVQLGLRYEAMRLNKKLGKVPVPTIRVDLRPSTSVYTAHHIKSAAHDSQPTAHEESMFTQTASDDALNEHSAAVNKGTTTLRLETTTLNENSTTLNEVTITLNEETTTLHEDTAILNEEILNEETAILDWDRVNKLLSKSGFWISTDLITKLLAK